MTIVTRSARAGTLCRALEPPEFKPGRGEPKWDIAGEQFWRKSDVEAWARYLKSVYPVGYPLTGEDRAFMVDLFTQYALARGEYDPDNPIVKVVVSRNTEFMTLGFRVTYADGRESTPSVPKAVASLGGRDVSWMRFTAAARETIQPQINDFRLEEYEAGRDDAWDLDVDHLPPWEFREIVTSFLEEWEVTHRDLLSFEPSDKGVNRLAPPWRDRFCDFHLVRANLELVPREEHTRRTAERRKQRKGTV